MEPSEGGGAKKVVLHCFFLWDTTLAFGLEGSTAVANPGFKVRVGRELFFSSSTVLQWLGEQNRTFVRIQGCYTAGLIVRGSNMNFYDS
jgi:hypothetical protein